MANILLFPEPPSISKKGLKYLAVNKVNLNHELASTLSPHYMYWNETIILIDLSYTYDYWLKEANKSNCEIEHLIENILYSEYKDRSFFASLAESPWECLILIKVAQDKLIDGLIRGNTQKAKNLANYISWDNWFDLCRELSLHEKKQNTLTQKKYEEVEKNINFFVKTKDLLNIKKPYDLKSASSSAIYRRFGKQLSRLWELSFTKNVNFHDFPWSFYRQAKKSR